MNSQSSRRMFIFIFLMYIFIAELSIPMEVSSDIDQARQQITRVFKTKTRDEWAEIFFGEVKLDFIHF